jgi:hypothetical protein
VASLGEITLECITNGKIPENSANSLNFSINMQFIMKLTFTVTNHIQEIFPISCGQIVLLPSCSHSIES